MATKGIKTFKFTNCEGVTIKVKFYSSDIYTITDKNGEHELGTWEKKPMLVGRYHQPSKDKNMVIYFGTSFARGYKADSDYTMRELAYKLLQWEILQGTIEIM